MSEFKKGSIERILNASFSGKWLAALGSTRNYILHFLLKNLRSFNRREAWVVLSALGSNENPYSVLQNREGRLWLRVLIIGCRYPWGYNKRLGVKLIAERKKGVPEDHIVLTAGLLTEGWRLQGLLLVVGGDYFPVLHISFYDVLCWTVGYAKSIGFRWIKILDFDFGGNWKTG